GTEQVKVQVFKILPRIEQTVNEQLEAEVLTRSSHSSKTSYAVVVDLSEMEVKKILIEKMEGNKDDEMMMLIRMKNPSLDQTGGPRDAEKERSLSQQALLWKLLPGALAGQHKGLNFNRRRQASLFLKRSLYRPPVRWKFPHIQSLTPVLKINQLYSLLSILNGFLNNINHHLRIVVGIRLCQLSMEAFNHG
nr:hypothetical protein [Tanacetum cinerariifolium]